MNEMQLPKASVMLEKFASDLNLETLYAGRGLVTLSSLSVDRPGLRLAGFFSYYDNQRIILIGLSEHEYMRSFQSQIRKEKIMKLFESGDIPCVIFSRDLPVLPEFMESASGVGKSETAMELIKRGHRLVVDDSVIIKRMENKLVGSSPEQIRYFMELRGIGIINVKNMYGSGSVLGEKEVELVMELEHWRRDKEYDRIGGEANTEEILSVKVPKLTVPVSPGRNLAILIEVAARDFRLKSMGYDAAQELIQRTIGR